MTRATRIGLIVVIGLTAACSREQLGLPRTPVSVVSPDGRWVAFVRNHPNPDPPSQTIWLGPVGGTAKNVETLGPDSDWCNRIVWSADSSTVSYLVQDERLITVDAGAARIISVKHLTAWQGEYPPYRMVRNLSLSSDGHAASFEDCKRQRTDQPYVHQGSDCSPMKMVPIQ